MDNTLAGCAMLLLLAAPVRAAEPADPPTEPDQRGLMTLLKDRMAGQPVIAVGVGDIEHGVHFDEAAYAKEAKNVGRLQVLSAAVSGDTETYIPFLVRNAWVIAPETRAETRTDLAGTPDIEAEGRGLLLDQMILSLAPDLLKEAGSNAGIPATRMSPTAQGLLARVLKPPIPITQSRDGFWTDENGKRREGFQYDRVGVVAEPPDLSKIQVRIRLWFENAEVLVDRSYQPLGRQRRHQMPGVNLGDWRNVVVPAETVAANKFKPSDLDGKAYAQPFGADGVMSISQALERVEKATALTLYPGAYGEAPVFVGSPEVTCGEVLDGLRLAITGAWRKVGNGYVLCWDRRGIAALNQTLTETSRPMVERITRLASDVGNDPRWLDIAEKLPFAPDDRLALTAEQRKRFYQPPTRPKDGEPYTEEIPGIPFSDMTPDQQDYLEECAKTDQMSLWPEGPFDPFNPPVPEHRPFTPDDVRAARLSAAFGPSVALDIRFPGYGWVRESIYGQRRLSPDRIFKIRETIAREKAQAERAAAPKATPPPRPQPPPGVFTPKPFRIAAPNRGIMVGPMRAAELNALASRMKTGRFTTLYYPALHDGYATAPSSAFPLHPDLKGENGMAAAIAAAKANGLKIIAYLSPVTWRSERQATHWLDEHPDWLDRDPLGRTRLQWLKESAKVGGQLPNPLPEITRRDYVRPTDPAVIQRLELLVDETARSAANGLMVLEWHPQDVTNGGRSPSPPLGFALADRLAALQTTGYDPLDATPMTIGAASVYVSPPDSRLLGRKGVRWVGIGQGGFYNLYDPPKPDPYIALAERLLDRAKSIRKDWVTGIVDPGVADPHQYERPDTPPVHAWKTDRILSEWESDGARDGRIVPDLPWDEAEAGGWVPDAVRGHSSLLFCDWSAQGLSRNAKTVVMDFRFQPAHLNEVLKYASAGP